MGTSRIGELLNYSVLEDSSELYDKVIAIDAHNIIYSFYNRIRNTEGQLLVGREGHTVGHLWGILNRTIGLLEARIMPLYVFDGKPHPLRKSAIQPPDWEQRPKFIRDSVKQYHITKLNFVSFWHKNLCQIGTNANLIHNVKEKGPHIGCR